LTVCGVLSTIGIAYLLLRFPGIKHAVVTRDADLVGFVTYGLAISLIASAARVIRRRDTVIVILAATIIWVVFVEVGQISGMLRFLVSAAAITLGVLAAYGLAAGRPRWARAVWGILLPGVLCGAAGTLYCALAALAGRMPGALPDLLAAAATSGLALGLAVGLGLWAGGELLLWMNRDGS
jgi:hypothetical protein